jgi:hypothetical protein
MLSRSLDLEPPERLKMKHATEEGLRPITDLLDEIRREARVKERLTGIFYSRGKAFLHFHEDPRGIFGEGIRTPDLRSAGTSAR